MDKILVAYGDGIGPEIMEVTLSILKESGAKLFIETIDVGEKVYLSGHMSGITDESWTKIKENKVLLKAPITTPLGKGYKSLNVTFRKALGLFANIRPILSYEPFVPSLQKDVDFVIIRENEEDLYAGIEYRPTSSRYIAIKLLTSYGCERIIRYAFEYAINNGRKKVTCVTKNNIMKITDGAFSNIFEKVSAEYPQIQANHMIVDIATARIVSNPKIYDVIVTLNLYGDIMSDVGAETTGSVGLAGSANIGNEYAMFEAVHGSAPDIAGQNKANPSGLINASVMMLRHLGQYDIADKIQDALLVTLEDGIHTADIYKPDLSKKLVGTKEFGNALIANLGKKPKKLHVHEDQMIESGKDERKNRSHNFTHVLDDEHYAVSDDKQKVLGVDIFINKIDVKEFSHLANKLNDFAKDLGMHLHMISSRGLKIWPINVLPVFTGEFLRFRFLFDEELTKYGKDTTLTLQYKIYKLQEKIIGERLAISISMLLYDYEGVRGYSLAQGE